MRIYLYLLPVANLWIKLSTSPLCAFWCNILLGRMGLRGVTTQLSFLGIAAGIGIPQIQEEVLGLAEEAIADDVDDYNIKWK